MCAAIVSRLVFRRVSPKYSIATLVVLHPARLHTCPWWPSFSEAAHQSNFVSPLKSYTAHLRVPRHISSTTSSGRLGGKRLALLIDGDVVGMPECQRVLEFLSSAGASVIVSRMYLNTHKSEKHKDRLRNLGVQSVIVERWQGGLKDPADIELAMDALCLACSLPIGGSSFGRLDAIAIAAKDIDFVPVHRRIQSHKVESYLIYSKEYQQISLGNLRSFASACTGVLEVDNGADIVGDVTQAVDYGGEVCRKLQTLKYLPEEDARLLPAAIALFVQVNGLSTVREHHSPYFPLADVIRALHELLSAHPIEYWQPRPVGVVCVQGICNKRIKGNKSKVRDWPQKFLILEVSPRLVYDVLRGLGYLDEGYNSDKDEAVEVFLRMASMRGSLKPFAEKLLESTSCHHARVFSLHHAIADISASPVSIKIPQKDDTVRNALVQHGFLDSSDSGTNETFAAMQRYLRSRNLGIAKSYNMCVCLCSEDLDKVGTRASLGSRMGR